MGEKGLKTMHINQSQTWYPLYNFVYVVLEYFIIILKSGGSNQERSDQLLG